MKTSIIKNDVWKDDELYKLHLDSKLLYLFLLSHPEREDAHVWKWNKRFASMYTGLSGDQIEVSLKQLVDAGFVDVYNGYIALLKQHFTVSKNRYSEEREAKQLAELPEDVYAHFIDKKPIAMAEKKAKKPKVEKIDQLMPVIEDQPAPLRATLATFVQDRIDRKKPPTEGAIKLWVNKLNKMYPNQYAKQIASLEQSIEKGWSGIFEVKSSKDPNSKDREFL